MDEPNKVSTQPLLRAAVPECCCAGQGIALRDLKRVTVLGAGAFGQVLLVKAAGQYYALKCLNKEQIVKMGLQVRWPSRAGVFRERRPDLLLRTAAHVGTCTCCLRTSSTPHVGCIACLTGSCDQAWHLHRPETQPDSHVPSLLTLQHAARSTCKGRSR